MGSPLKPQIMTSSVLSTATMTFERGRSRDHSHTEAATSHSLASYRVVSSVFSALCLQQNYLYAGREKFFHVERLRTLTLCELRTIMLRGVCLIILTDSLKFKPHTVEK